MTLLNSTNQNAHYACSHCDLICEIPALSSDQIALCPGCESVITQGGDSHHEHLLAIALAGLILLALSVPFNFISFAKQGLLQSVQLLDAVHMMFEYDQLFLANLINLTIFLLPASILVFVVMLDAKLLSMLPKRVQIFGTKMVFMAKDWCMPEIFLVAVLVSLVKIVSLADISIGPSFWAYFGFVFCFIYTLVKLNKMRIWDSVAHHSEFKAGKPGVRAIDQGLSSCHMCGITTTDTHCPRCDGSVHIRDAQNLQKTLAWTITATLIYIPANLFPIMTTVLLSDPEPATILGGVAVLWHHGSYPIALVIFVASVVIPLAKLGALMTLIYVAKTRSEFCRFSFTKLYTVIEFLGKWSMVDVFVVAILVALVHLGGIIEVIPGSGALFFSIMVITAMIATHTFDPRQLWDFK